MNEIVCLNCRQTFLPSKATHKFCSNKCRVEFHRHHMPVGVVSGVRKLSNGKISVTIHFDEAVALLFNVNDNVTVGDEG